MGNGRRSVLDAPFPCHPIGAGPLTVLLSLAIAHQGHGIHMKIVIVSTSLDVNSKSRTLANICKEQLSMQGTPNELIDLFGMNFPKFDNGSIYSSHLYLSTHRIIDQSDAIVLCSPVYNWNTCAELKNFIEAIGSTPPDGSRKGALYDKVVTFVNNGGLPHSYMAFTSLAHSLMMDFKCIINPYNVYTYDKHWHADNTLAADAMPRIRKSLQVTVELAGLLKNREYRSGWEV